MGKMKRSVMKSRVRYGGSRRRPRCGWGIGVVMGWCAVGHGAERPNILFILSDDQPPNATGFEGDPQAETPSLDRLAREGAFFSRCYVPTVRDAACRASILTGQYPHTHGVTAEGGPEDGAVLSRYADTFTARLAKSGYACGVVGKWVLSAAGEHGPGFGLTDFAATDGVAWKWDGGEVWVQGKKQVADTFLSDWHGDRAIEFIETFRDRSFFLWLCFRGSTPEAEADNESSRREANSAPDDLMSRMDQNVGRVLAKLDELGLSDRTIVVFASDGGRTGGERKRPSAGGATASEAAVRVPLLVRYPTIAPAGARIERLVSLMDVGPTLLELAGLPAARRMQGRSFARLLADPRTRHHADECFFELEDAAANGNRTVPIRGVVTRNYKLVDYLDGSGNGKDLFYDLTYDPEERHNGLEDHLYRSVVTVLRRRLEAWQRSTKDPHALSTRPAGVAATSGTPTRPNPAARKNPSARPKTARQPTSSRPAASSAAARRQAGREAAKRRAEARRKKHENP